MLGSSEQADAGVDSKRERQTRTRLRQRSVSVSLRTQYRLDNKTLSVHSSHLPTRLDDHKRAKQKVNIGAIYHISPQEWEALENSLIKNYLSEFHLYELQNLSTGCVRNLWNKYDPKQIGQLGRIGVMAFAQHVVLRLLAEARENMIRKKPTIKESALQSQIETDLPNLLPGHPHSLREATQYMLRLIATNFDRFHLGCVRREAFLTEWQGFATQVFSSSNEKVNPMICLIL